MKQSLSLRSVLSESWQVFKTRPFFLIGALLIANIVPFVISNILTVVSQAVVKPDSITQQEGIMGLFFVTVALVVPFLFQAINMAISLLISIGLTLINLNTVRGEHADYKMFISGKSYLIRVIMLMIIIFCVAVPAYLVFIIPGIIWTISVSFALVIIIDENIGSLEAIKKSMELTKGYRLKLFLWMIVKGLLTIAGAMALLIGLLVVLPVLTLGDMIIYKKLKEIKAPVQEV